MQGAVIFPPSYLSLLSHTFYTMLHSLQSTTQIFMNANKKNGYFFSPCFFVCILLGIEVRDLNSCDIGPPSTRKKEKSYSV